jgi:hypothetical protein
VVVIFRNHGVSAGTSLAHPHSRIVATPVVPMQIRHRFEVAIQHHDDVGTCLHVDILKRELRSWTADRPGASSLRRIPAVRRGGSLRDLAHAPNSGPIVRRCK